LDLGAVFAVREGGQEFVRALGDQFVIGAGLQEVLGRQHVFDGVGRVILRGFLTMEAMSARWTTLLSVILPTTVVLMVTLVASSATMLPSMVLPSLSLMVSAGAVATESVIKARAAGKVGQGVFFHGKAGCVGGWDVSKFHGWHKLQPFA
jgi:hypothetical protein